MMSAVAVWQEAVRGGFMAGSADLAGADRVRALMAPRALQPPLFRLTGMRLVQAGPGSATCSVPVSTLLLDPLQWVDVFLLMETAATMAGRAGAPPGRDVRSVVVSIHHQRVARLDAERLIARATTVHAGRIYSLLDVAVEDAVDRPVAHAMASLVGIDARDGDRHDAAEPFSPAPDPWQRPFPVRAVPEALAAYAGPPAGDADVESLLAPIHSQLGLGVIEKSPGPPHVESLDHGVAPRPSRSHLGRRRLGAHRLGHGGRH